MNHKTRVAIIGLGKVAENIHLPACASLPEVEVVGACEPDQTRRQRIADKFRVGATYDDAVTLLKRTQPDLVIVGTPPDTHHALSLLALRQGAHVFCEKPFVTSLAQADELIAEADVRGRLLWVNNQYRHMRIYAETHRRVARGEFGRAFFLQGWQQMHHPPTQDANWRAQLKQSLLFEFGTHALDLICFLFDALPLSVVAHMPRVLAGTEADVLVQLAMRFPGERLATLALNRVSHAPERYLEMRLDCERASLRISLGGVARASLDWSKVLGHPVGRFSFTRGGEARAEAGGHSRLLAVEPRAAYASATAIRLRECIAAIQRGECSNAAARHARAILRVALAGYDSARSGETVWLNRQNEGGNS